MGIVSMTRVTIFGTISQKDVVLEILQQLSIIHLQPLNNSVGHNQKESHLRDLWNKVLAYANGHKPIHLAEVPSNLIAFAEELIEQTAQAQKAIAALEQEIKQQKRWGDFSPTEVEVLRQRGVYLQLWQAKSPKSFWRAKNSGIQVFQVGDKKHFYSISSRLLELQETQNLPLPKYGLSEMRNQIANHQKVVEKAMRGFAWLANQGRHLFEQQLVSAINQQATDWAKSHLHRDEHLFVVTGWMPSQDKPLIQKYADTTKGICITFDNPTKDDTPPTLTRHHKLVKPIESVFKILGITSGYHEPEISLWFVIGLTIFSAMLIADGGYGLLVLLPLIIFYKKLVKKVGTEIVHMGLYISTATVIYGLMTGNFFGITLPDESLVGIFKVLDSSNDILMQKLCLLIGVCHLSLAHLYRSVILGIHKKTLCEIGWICFLWGLYFLANTMILSAPMSPLTTWLLGIGTLLVIGFTNPSTNLLKTIGCGLANILQNAVGAFSDLVSYIRLMAIGMASTMLAVSFNEIASSTHSPAAAIPILLIGHSLNLGLCGIALFAHGVRLNVLEFCRHLEINWTGEPFKPFQITTTLTTER